MAKMEFTKDQQKVIDLRDCNVLVSAAAGSGKTAVLVERIMKKISSEKHPVDIDRLLIVTFTDAAAGEMRERISRAIEEKRREEPENTHLERQASLVHNAQITTIHSFCLNVLRNYFNEIDLDPGFRLGDETELKLLKADVLEEVIEGFYEEKSPEFLALVESYATGKKDEAIISLVLRLFEFSMSYPWPKQWLKEQRRNFMPESLEAFWEAGWQKELLGFLKTEIKDCLEENELALKLALTSDGPYMYEDALRSDREHLERLSRAEGYQEIGRGLKNILWTKLSAKKDDCVNPDKRELVKLLRDSVKKAVKGLEEKYYFQSEEAMLEDMEKAAPAMNGLIDLTLAFMEAYQEKKAEKNLLDFNDLEHLALKVLVKEPERDSEQPVPTETAVALSRFYEEILIDEYQDSNLVQETLLNSISREKFGHPNVFMVGDVKQSIYKFRLARPELFMEKFETYQEAGDYVRVDLKKNFRSRESVLGAINYIFFGIMKKDLGNIQYDEAAALYPGRKDIEKQTAKEQQAAEEKLWKDCEILISESLEEVTDKELEGKMIAGRIKKLREEKDIPYKDMVILLRSMKGWSEELAAILKEEGIPARAATQTGYFSAVEVMTVLNLLLIIDNPRQDIPLAAVLRSFIGKFSDEELAHLRCIDKEAELYDCLLRAAKADIIYEAAASENVVKAGGETENLQEKARNFMDLLHQLRSQVPHLGIYELLTMIYEETGYYHYVSALPGGQVRSANLDMLLKKGADFEKTSYGGLFQFNRYIERLHEYDVDFGEAAASGDSQDMVTIMSIHKSKGLEFPVVFLAGMGKSFNKQDTRERLLLHPELGLGPDFIDSGQRTKSPTLLKQVIKRKTDLENMGEELRVLYVAMTRAREKLILTGCVKDRKKAEAKWHQNEPMLFSQRASAACYLDFIMPRVFSWQKGVKPEEKGSEESCRDFSYKAEYLTGEELTFEAVFSQMEREGRKAGLLSYREAGSDAENIFWTPEEKEKAEACLTYQYPYQKEGAVKSKLTVSELKRLSQEEEIEEAGETLEALKPEEAYIPAFAREEEAITGSQRGTLYHRIMENISFVQAEAGGLKAELTRLTASEKLSEAELPWVSFKKLSAFLSSDLGKRLARAERENTLHREQPFVIGLPAKELQPETDSEETVLVQGVIDCFFEDGDGLVLMDYKTDRTESGPELMEKYKIQLEYYKSALERLTGKQVKETYIYSFYLEASYGLHVLQPS